MIHEILKKMPFLDEETYILKDLGHQLGRTEESLKRRAKLFFSTMYKVMGDELDFAEKVFKCLHPCMHFPRQPCIYSD